MFARAAAAAVARRGYAEHGKENSMPLSKSTVIVPSLYRAETGVSIKVFMPFIYDKLFVFDRQILCFCQFHCL